MKISKRRRNRFLSLALAFLLGLTTFAVMPVTAFADENNFTVGGTGYASLDTAIAAVPVSGSATIRVDVDGFIVTTPVVIDNKDIRLDLNGNDLVIDTSAATLPVYSTPALTLKGGGDLHSFGTSGTFNVKGKYYALRAESGASVTIRGSITSTQRYSNPSQFIWGEGNAISVDGTDIDISLTGDISSEAKGIEIYEDSEAVIGVGEISAYGDGIEIWAGTTVTISTGGINSYSTAVYIDESTVSLKTTGGIWGNSGMSGVNASHSDVDVEVTENGDGDHTIYGQTAIRSNGSTVNVDGALIAATEIGIYTEGDPSQIVAVGDVDAAGTGIFASPNSEVIVTGEVYGSRDGIEADSSTAKVNGDVIGGTGVKAWNGATVDIAGDVTADGYDGAGVEAKSGATVNVAGDVASEGDEGVGVTAYDTDTLVKIDGMIRAYDYIIQWHWDDGEGEYGDYVKIVKTAGDDDAAGSPDAQGYRVYTGMDGSVVKVGNGVEQSADARLIIFAGQAAYAVGAGTKTEPKTASFPVPNSKTMIGYGGDDLIVASGARPNIYRDGTFGGSILYDGIPLSVGVNHVYIEVVAADGVTKLYYDITVTREAGGGNNNGGDNGGNNGDGGDGNNGGDNGGDSSGNNGGANPDVTPGQTTTPPAGSGAVKVKLPKTKIMKVAVGKRLATVTFKKVARAQKVTKYQLQYRVKGAKTWKSKNFTVKDTGAKTAKVTIKKRTKGKRYQFRVRAWKMVGGKKYYAPWSAAALSGKVK